jgi:excisionase family DNA binding protein
VQNMHSVQINAPAIPEPRGTEVEPLLTAQQVQAMFGVDRSTVYRMAEDGRLAAVKVGRQWRFRRSTIEAYLAPPRSEATITALADNGWQAAVEVAAELLGVMMVVTDMDGRPLTLPANPCPRFANADEMALAACAGEWKQFADEFDVTPRFRVGPLGFECARTFVRVGHQLVAMVLAGGIAAPGDTSDDLHVLDVRHRARVLESLPRVAAALSQSVVRTAASA